MENSGYPLENIFGNFTIWLDFETDTLVKLMFGLIIVLVVSSVISNAIINR